MNIKYSNNGIKKLTLFGNYFICFNLFIIELIVCDKKQKKFIRHKLSIILWYCESTLHHLYSNLLVLNLIFSKLLRKFYIYLCYFLF